MTSEGATAARRRALDLYLASPPPDTVLHEGALRWIDPARGIVYGYRPVSPGVLSIKPITTLDSDGYVAVKAQQRCYKGHILVWETVNGPIPDADHPDPRLRPQVNHKNFVRHDNWIGNLELLLPGGNVRYSRDAGRLVVFPGSRNPQAKLTEDQVLAIRAASGSNREIAEQFGVSRRLIGMIKARVLWKHVGEEVPA